MQHLRQILLRCHAALFHGLVQQALETHLPQRLATMSRQHLAILRTRIHRPSDFQRRRIAQRLTVPSSLPNQHDPYLTRPERLCPARQTTLGFFQNGFRNLRRILKVAFQHAQESLLRRFGLQSFDFVFVHHLSPRFDYSGLAAKPR